MFPLRDVTVYEAFSLAKESYGGNLALTYGDSIWTYDELYDEVTKYALKLYSLGVRKGIHVGINCDNTPMFVIYVLALSKIGAVAVLINNRLHENELSKVIRLTDATLVLTDDYDFENVPCASLEELENVDPNDDGYILFTSGTTANPRAAIGSHSARANMGYIQGKDLKASPSDRFCVTMPLFHCFSFSVNFMSALFYGACLCLPESRHSEDILTTIGKYKCTILSGVPTFFHTLLSKYDLSQYDISSLRAGFIGGSGYSASFFKETEEKLQMTILSSLGQTEATAAITTTSLNDSFEIRAKTVGHFIDNVEYKILSTGEICIRGFNVMNLYYKNPGATEKAIDNEGWLHTGDAGYMQDNNLVLTGRIKEFIIRGGENISPLEIESVLYEDNRIFESKAVGVYDSHYGEEVALCIIRNNDSNISEEDVREKLKNSIADYKIPKYILFMNKFPKANSGKVINKDLKEQVTSLLGLK